MGQTLTNGIYLPAEGEINCYAGLAANWTTLDSVVGGYRAHVANENIHITSEERSKWDTGVTQAYVLRYASVSLTALGTVAFSALDNTDNVKIGDKVLDSEGKLFALTAVDTANSSATLSALLIDLSKDSDLSNYYTKNETDALLNDKADDSAVMHLTGDEQITGFKQFDYLRANKCITAISLANQTIDLNTCYSIESPSGASASGNTCYYCCNTDAGTANISNLPKNKAFFLISQTIRYISGGVYVKQTCITSDGSTFVRYCINNTWSAWNNVHDELEPSSLFMPADRGSRVDIAAYFSNTGSGYTNDYIVPANGYILLNLTNVKAVTCYSLDGSSITNYAQSYQISDDGQIYAFFPVRKNDKFRTLWYSIGGTVTVSGAFFIPCKGNV